MEHGGPCLQSMLFIFVAWIYTIITKNTRKKTQIPHILIFFNKEYSVFPNLQCASCWFPFIVLPLPPLSLPAPPPPTPPTSSSPTVTKIDDFHASSITGPEWVYLLSFMVTLENAVCCLQSRLEPLTHSSKVISCLPSYSDELSSWKYCWKVIPLMCLVVLKKITLRFSSVLLVNAM